MTQVSQEELKKFADYLASKGFVPTSRPSESVLSLGPYASMYVDIDLYNATTLRYVQPTLSLDFMADSDKSVLFAIAETLSTEYIDRCIDAAIYEVKRIREAIHCSCMSLYNLRP